MSTQKSIPVLSADDLASLDISTIDVVDMIAKLVRGRAEGTVWSAPKVSLPLPDTRYIMATLAVADEPPLLGVKSLLLNPRNPARGEPLMNSIITLQDSETGVPVAVMDGNWVTAVRTAALSALAARHMARPASETIAFIGCGVQARSHLKAFHDLYPLKTAHIFGRGRANIDALGAVADEMGLACHVAASPQEALAEADIIVSSVTREPGAETFADPAWIRPGAFAALTDLARPWHQDGLAGLDRVIIDDRAQEALMKDPMVPNDAVSGDLTELVLGQVPGRGSDSERTAFVFRGYALGDFALAALAFQEFTQAG